MQPPKGVANPAIPPVHEEQHVDSTGGGSRLQPEVRVLLAKLVAQPRGWAVLIGADGAPTGRCRIPDAVARNVTFRVTPAIDMLISEPVGPDMYVALDDLAAALREARHPPVLVAVDPHRRQLFCRVPDPKPWRERAQALGLPTSAMRPTTVTPPFGMLLDPATLTDALVALGTRARSHGLSPRLSRLLKDGDVDGRYGDKVSLAIALAAANRGWTEARLYRALLDPKNRGGALVQDIQQSQGEAAARTHVATLYEAASKRRQESPPTHPGALDAGDVIARLREAANRACWSWPSHAGEGVSGGTCRAVLDAHLRIAARIGSVTYGASIRQIAEEAGIHRTTVPIAHDWLIRAGWLPQPETGSGGSASRWVLECNVSLPFSMLEETGSGTLQRPGFLDGPAADYFRHRGAGKQTERVFLALWNLGDSSTARVAEKLVMKGPAARQHLRKLRGDRIARKVGPVWSLVPDVEQALIQAAIRRGTFGAAAVQHAEHVSERPQFARALELKALRRETFGLVRQRRWSAVQVSAKVTVEGEAAWRRFIGKASAARLLRLRGRLASPASVAASGGGVRRLGA